MLSPQPGQRIQINHHSECHIRILGQNADRLAIAAVNGQGAVLPFQSTGSGNWYVPSFDGMGEQFEILAYITDDRMGGFANQSYPIHLEIAGERYDLPKPEQQLAAVILGEIYSKNGSQRLKISNEGFTFGIDAYLRGRNFQNVKMPHRHYGNVDNIPPARPEHRRPSPSQSQQIGSGSGVVIAPGTIITNAHVIADGENFRLGSNHQTVFPIAVDPFHDLALLKGEFVATPLPLRIGSHLWLGEPVFAAGFPLMHILGSDLKITTGNVSGLSGGRGDISRFQFSAPIGSGSSGGAIIDEQGNLVGITSASLAHDTMRDNGSVSENVNFGIKASLVAEMIAAAGIALPQLEPTTDSNRRDVINRVRTSVVSIIVSS